MAEIIPREAIERQSLSVQPLMFETDFPCYPYSINGTLFLVGYEADAYLITTRHGLYPKTLYPICIFPTDTSSRLIPLNRVFFVPEEFESRDFVDVAVIDLDSEMITDAELSQTTIIDLARAHDRDWESKASEMEFFVIGYPKERSNIDFDLQQIRTDRITLFGSYKGDSELPYLHVIHVDNPQGLTSFDGFSGSPVFMWSRSEIGLPTPILCGMAIRGTANSRLIHFLPTSIILSALAIKRQKDNVKSVGGW